ncbi:DUF6077 domain-containing protein, partial [Luteimonas sp. 8-5]|uniref:DUF6077 domain-containing protein n=1 Tax=Luteimonas sp. 8-5 TaxID=3039387 RepID=UPI0024371225
MPALVLPYAIWTIYVHLVVAIRGSFTLLLTGLPVVVLLAAAATAGWFRLREREAPALPASATQAIHRRTPALAVLATATLWVALSTAGMPYLVFWWGALLGTGLAWVWLLRGGELALPESRSRFTAAWLAPAWIVPAVVLVAVCVVLFASRPSADDAFYLSIPATLLRFPEQPVLLHDTMYRLQDAPIMLPFYRLSNTGVLVAVVARLTGIDHVLVAHVVLPVLFAIACVLAWIHLLRRIVPSRWPIVLPILLLCVLALGEQHHAYGNFSFVRLFHGKAMLASCLVPVVAAAAMDHVRHGGIRRWLLLFAAMVAALGVTASALFVAPAAAALGLAGGW